MEDAGRIIYGGELKDIRLFKLTSIDEVHNGVKYTTGKVTDILPFNDDITVPIGPGGLYFSELDSLYTIILMDWAIHCMHHRNIREVHLDDNEKVVAIPATHGLQCRAHSIYVSDAMPLTELSTWKYLYELNVSDSKRFFHFGIVWATEFDLPEISEYLREVMGIGDDINIYTYMTETDDM